MPRTTYPKDRFDDLTADTGRVGAHRAENPRIRAGVVVFWSFVSIIVLVAVGIFGTLVYTGRISLFPEAEPTSAAAPAEEVAPVVDTTYPVLILNATPQRGLANSTRDAVIGAGWTAEAVSAGEAGSQDFATTTVFFTAAEDEGAARGLAEVIGGAAVELSDAYPGAVDADGVAAKQLTIVIGADRVTSGEAPEGE